MISFNVAVIETSVASGGDGSAIASARQSKPIYGEIKAIGFEFVEGSPPAGTTITVTLIGSNGMPNQEIYSESLDSGKWVYPRTAPQDVDGADLSGFFVPYVHDGYVEVSLDSTNDGVVARALIFWDG